MENQIIQKTKEFGNYLLTVYDNDNHHKDIIETVFFKNLNNNMNFINGLRPENNLENKEETIKDENGNEKIVKSYSQINSFINVFGLPDNEEVKNKLKEYLNELLKYKN